MSRSHGFSCWVPDFQSDSGPFIGTLARACICFEPKTRRHFSGADALHVELTPLANRVQCLFQRVAVLGQGVLDLGRYRRKHTAIHNPISLELAQLLRQHFLCDARYQPPQFSEPVSALMQPPENERFPFATDDIDRSLNRTI